jgi:hypothetical protein
MRDGSAVIVLQRGYSVTGKVLDSTGVPVANALVAWGDDAYARQGSQDTRSKEDGSFQLGAVPAGPTRLTVIADKWMPQTSKIEVGEALQPVETRLQPGKRLKVRFVDGDNHPIPNVRVGITRWRGQQSMFFEGINNLFEAIAPMQSDREGVFEWTWAPDDEVHYVFTKQGFAHAEANLTAADSEQVQTLYRLLEISGTVKDATTGQQIDKFLAIPIIHFTPEFPSVNRQDAKRQTAGKFALRYDRTDIEHGLQIEAPGYITWRTSRRYKMGDTSPALDVRLQPSAPSRCGQTRTAPVPVISKGSTGNPNCSNPETASLNLAITCSFSSGSTEQVEYTSLPPGFTICAAFKRIRSCRAAKSSMSAGEMRQRISGLRLSVPVPVQGASTSTQSKVEVKGSGCSRSA